MYMKDSTKTETNLLLYDGQFFDKGYTSMIGADEVGRGPLAGPVMAGAVWIDRIFYDEYCAVFYKYFQCLLLNQ